MLIKPEILTELLTRSERERRQRDFTDQQRDTLCQLVLQN